jgi:hypothetical protein
MAWKQKGLCLLFLIFLALPTGIYPFNLHLPLRGMGHVARESHVPAAHTFLDLTSGRRTGQALTQINTLTALKMVDAEKMVSLFSLACLCPGFHISLCPCYRVRTLLKSRPNESNPRVDWRSRWVFHKTIEALFRCDPCAWRTYRRFVTIVILGPPHRQSALALARLFQRIDTAPPTGCRISSLPSSRQPSRGLRRIFLPMSS